MLSDFITKWSNREWPIVFPEDSDFPPDPPPEPSYERVLLGAVLVKLERQTKKVQHLEEQLARVTLLASESNDRVDELLRARTVAITAREWVLLLELLALAEDGCRTVAQLV